MTDFNWTKSQFHLPDGITYLDGNSLGPLPKNVTSRIEATVENEWGEMLVSAWNRAGWMVQPNRVGNRIGRLVGAEPDTVSVGDTLSIKIFQALAAALQLNPDRKVVLSDTGNFPSDLYIAEGLLKLLDREYRLVTVEPDEVESAIGPDTAALMLTHVDYRTGRMHDMARLTETARKAGSVTVWDLAHSAGAVPVDLAGCGADFAAGCTYKYLNAGPGAPAFIYARPGLHDRMQPALSGWLGHAAPFAFDPDYRAAEGIARMRIGTPPVIQMTALETALDVWDQVDMADLRARSVELTEYFIRAVKERCPDLDLFSPRDAGLRGSQVSFRFEHGYEMMQALIARGVVGDFRAPDVMRFGIAPLYIDEDNLARAVEVMAKALAEKAWQKAEYQVRADVT